MRRPKERSPAGSLSEQPHLIPFGFAVEIDRLFEALTGVEKLLALGRPYGLTVALSPALAAQIEMRHGDAATGVLSNTRRIDPEMSPSRSGVAFGRLARLRRIGTYLGSAAVLATLAGPVLAQQAQTLNGAPIQMQPFVTEPGAPTVTVNPGTPNPFGGLDGGDGTGGSGGDGGTGSGGTGDSDALTTMLGTSWGASAAANAQALGVNASALAATCVVESGCQNVAGSGSVAGAFQMTTSTYNAMLQAAIAQNPSLASQAVFGQAGQMNPQSESIAAAEYLAQGAQYLQNQGISNPSVLDVRGYYNFGPQGGAQIAQASPDQTMSSVLTGYSAATLAKNGITSGETVGQWQAGVTSKIGNAAGQSVLNG